MTASNHELVLELTLDAPREKVWRCWTEADLLEQWFAPKPFTITVESLDVRPGGASLFIFRGPDGQEMRNAGVYLEVINNEKLVFTDAYTKAWTPSDKPFMTAEIELKDVGDSQTQYTATARHWSAQDLKQHEEMGFYDGWTKAAEQLVAVAKKL